MVRAEFLIWTCCCLVLVLSRFHVVRGAQSIAGLGVNWGSLASHPMKPSIVVKMLKDNGIKKIKLFDSESYTLDAFVGTDIEVMVGIPNDQLSRFATTYEEAEDWVQQDITKYMHDGGVNIRRRYVAVGNEPFLKSYNGSFLKSTFPAMQNVQKALEASGIANKIKVTVPLNADVYTSTSNNPSDGEFRKDTHDVMLKIVRFLNDHKSPFLVNIYPFLSLYESNHFPHEFAFFDGGKSIDDNNAHYTNVFDANFDTLVSSLKRAGFPNTKIIVGEVGWPTDGDKNANPENAKRFYKGLMKKLGNKEGTPLHSNPIEAYLFALFDEDQKSIQPGTFERHWGIFRKDGAPKFEVDFSGQGRERMPVGAQGVVYQARQWCVVSPDESDTGRVGGALGYACQSADCTSLANGGSCADLDVVGRASFALNQYFQVRDQSEEACDFEGVGEIVKEDPTRGKCFFPIEIVSGTNGGILKVGYVVGGLVLGFFFFIL
ncbi:glucan endo-1,3-beta-glucosidase 8 [Senna tora]|uniref:glucan endo-1,3-beta-D-glucosidase n=1 Tax=Senna tora TaxID=362788 RepID=A0A835C9G3_9FABA|nr:glucan endo-1,3-beta-glucosidase 8 [Senna tora]